MTDGARIRELQLLRKSLRQKLVRRQMEREAGAAGGQHVELVTAGPYDA